MDGFDDPGIFYSDVLGDEEREEASINLQASKKLFKHFLRDFSEGNSEGHKYREQLYRHYQLGQYWLEVNLEDLRAFDEELFQKINKQPAEYLALCEEAATEVADELTHPRPQDDDPLVHPIQVQLNSTANPQSVRDINANQVSKLIKIPGIVIGASGVKPKASRISIQCRGCRNVIPDISIRPGMEAYVLPRKCTAEQPVTGAPNCPLDPYFILPNKCKCVDYQILKLQELPEFVPYGEMPRHLQLYCDRDLCERAVPGNRVTIIGIYSIRKAGRPAKREGKGGKSGVGIRPAYIRVVGMEVASEGPGRSGIAMSFSREEVKEYEMLANSPDCYEKISSSIAPSIFGSADVKKAISCLLFGGARKRLPDGLYRRGDINVLLLGDPGTAKSQLLKFVEQVSPIGVYTSGKGSSAAGLTAAVIRDPVTRNFVMEGGAMVLGDGGVVCIDEFDKMREDDRVAIHEAMEQQTISIAKAGITTTLNSRCSVLAAANSVFGRWDETKGEENIDFMPTILSRFDMIFLVKDEHSAEKDKKMAKHVMNIHMNSAQVDKTTEGELSLAFLKKYIAYCRTHCFPRLSEPAGEKLKNRYVLMRSGTRESERESDKRLAIPITVRQLEAIIRISEALARMRLQEEATDVHVEEALRLFQVSTLEAAHSGSLAGVEGFTSEEDHETLVRVETQLKRRFPVGAQISEHAIVQDFLKQRYPEQAVYKVIHFMIRRGEIQHRLQRKMLYRLR